MRAFWKGSLSFGLVNIPVSVYLASEDKGLEFDMLHKKDLSPIRYAKICKLEENEIPYNEIVKGYEYEKGQYVIVEPEDFKKANRRKTSTIDIQSFSEIDEIDPIYYERPYYLEPDKKAQKAYKVLLEALKKSKKVAIGNFVFHNKEHFGMIMPQGDALVLIQLRYHNNIRAVDDLSLPQDIKATAQEIDVALQLIKNLTVPFEAEEFRDTYTEELMATIESKLKGKKAKGKGKETITTPSMKAGDLMHLLKASLNQSLKEPKEERKKVHRAPKPHAKTKRKR